VRLGTVTRQAAKFLLGEPAGRSPRVGVRDGREPRGKLAFALVAAAHRRLDDAPQRVGKLAVVDPVGSVVDGGVGPRVVVDVVPGCRRCRSQGAVGLAGGQVEPSPEPDRGRERADLGGVAPAETVPRREAPGRLDGSGGIRRLRVHQPVRHVVDAAAEGLGEQAEAVAVATRQQVGVDRQMGRLDALEKGVGAGQDAGEVGGPDWGRMAQSRRRLRLSELCVEPGQAQLGLKGLRCTCSPLRRRTYLDRIRGPVLDRIDIQVFVPAPSRAMLVMQAGETTAVVATRVQAARARQAERWAGTGLRLNVHVPGPVFRTGAMRLPRGVTSFLDAALDRGGFSMRAYDRCLKLA